MTTDERPAWAEVMLGAFTRVVRDLVGLEVEPPADVGITDWGGGERVVHVQFSGEDHESVDTVADHYGLPPNEDDGHRKAGLYMRRGSIGDGTDVKLFTGLRKEAEG